MHVSHEQHQLLSAIACDRQQQIHDLLTDGLDPNFEGDCCRVTPLMLAVFTGSCESCRTLLHHGAFPGLFDHNESFSPMMWAALAGNQVIADLLNTYGPQVNIRTDDGVTAIVLARQFNQHPMERWLVRRGAELGGPPSLRVNQQIAALEDYVNEARRSNANPAERQAVFAHESRTCVSHPITGVFSQHRAILPVIHAETLDQVRRNVDITIACKADGAFLINHAISFDELFAISIEVREEYPDFWLGINALDLLPAAVIERVPEGIQGIWVDDAMIDETRVR